MSQLKKGIEDVYELTPIQQGLLFEQLANGDAGVYIEQLLLTFDGTLHPEEFQRAWQMVVDRHPILRTSFHWRPEGLPLQVVHQHAELPLEVLDWRHIPVAEQKERITEWLDRERVEGFDVTQAPVMRLSVIHSEPETWIFAWRLSHLLMDGWSFGLAVSDFIDCYRAQCLGYEPERRPMRPYRDYVAWWSQRDPEGSLPFWRSELAGFTPPEQLRMGGTPPAPGEPSHGFVELSMAELEAGLRDLGRTNQLTLNTLVQGAWLVVLSHHYGTTDVACGFTMAHRPAELRGSENILGPLISTMPVRERLEPTRAALSWLRDFQIHITAVRENTSSPLFEVQRVLNLPLDVPLLESSVSYENMPMPDFALAETGMKLTEMRYDGRPHYPITMVIMPGEGMPLRVIYDRSRFSPEAAHRFCDHLRTVLTRLVESPELTVGELLPAEAVGPLPGATGDTPAPLDERPLHATFSDLAAANPDAEAVVFGDRRLTYGQLAAHSDAIAEELVERGVAPGDRVGLCLERSDALVAAMIGVFKAGAAYVPLDPEYPAERLLSMIDDAGITALVRGPDLAERTEGFTGPVLTVAEELPSSPTGRPLPEVGADAPAYVLYTSGSTGLPKAVVVTHRNAQSLLAAGRELFGFGAGDTWTFSHSFSFDYSVWEIWGALGNGGRLVVVPSWTVRSPDEFHALLRSEAVTVCSQTPILFEHFAAADEAATPADGEPALALRHIFIGGDRLHAATVRPWLARHGDDAPQLHNLYGVTEAAVVSTCHRLTSENVSTDAPLPIGRALPNQRAYLLDDRGRPVPPGSRGELCLAGPAVAAGYHAREELTARRFGVEPVAPAERMYRTGDQARALPDGTLEYLGRDDSQVKIRGYRVELGEIEAVLRSHPSVASSVAVARADAGGERILCYGVPGDGDRAPESEVRDFAARRLPAHMVPTAFGWLDALPTTVGGKIDVRALPELETTAGGDRGEAPRTDLERELAEVLSGLVSLPAVGRREEFADLGLHSAHMMRLMTTLRSRWNVSVPLRELYVSNTLEDLARLVERERA
ncbi:non-ribosomal peptide synthetase [Actinoalloteichus sp. AHMU CJ021]|uniref:non-ribosomal peptide synthetase n=1 Tax=Actinoalloteichus sp. AHMU CJ021 TaxID=2072503 RepID=UPI000CA0224A|nr:non-ribosomal peptide synthetase [Actinoalloteichus sp. AHMU CJ021]